jgi:hypothetical protein
MSIFGRLANVFGGKKQNIAELPVPKHEETPAVPTEERKNDEPVKYGVIVEMEHPGVLVEEEKIKEVLRGKLRGKVSWAIFFSESGLDNNSLAPCIRRFVLTEQSDLESFTQAMKTIDGVIGVKKGDGPWTKTATEQRAEEKEKKRIAKEKKKRAEESWKEREYKLAEFKKLKEETKKSDEETYGSPSTASRLYRQEFEEFLASVGHCEVEARAVFSDIFAGGFLDYEREVAKLAGNEVVAFFEKAMNGALRMPFQGQISFYDIPFSVEYRQNNGRKFAHLMIGGGKPTFIMARYDLFVRG